VITTEQRLSVVTASERWLRTPWHHNARVHNAGIDCGQLVIAAYVEAGLVDDFDTGKYSRDFMLHRNEERFLEVVTRYLDEIQGPPGVGDVAVWKIGKCYAHGAIVVQWPRIIHSYKPERSVVYGDASKGRLAALPVKFFSIEGRLP
jgi:cell wall-associated NlpC family hydrolase